MRTIIAICVALAVSGCVTTKDKCEVRGKDKVWRSCVEAGKWFG